MAQKYMNPGRIAFEAVIKTTDGGGAFVEFPYDVEEKYGVKGRSPSRSPSTASLTRARWSGWTPNATSSSSSRRSERSWERTGRQDPGDRRPRRRARVVVLSPDVEAAYKKAKVFERYRAMSFSHQRERNLWIEDAKQDETRKRRIAKSVEELRKRKA